MVEPGPRWERLGNRFVLWPHRVTESLSHHAGQQGLLVVWLTSRSRRSRSRSRRKSRSRREKQVTRDRLPVLASRPLVHHCTDPSNTAVRPG